MATMSTIAQRAERLLQTPVVATTPVAGGHVCSATRLRLSDGRTALVKTRPHPPAGFFETEARGLAWLAETGTVNTPEVLGQDDECLILTWIEPDRPSAEKASALGRQLAGLHGIPASSYGASGGVRGTGSGDGFIATLPLPNRPTVTWPEFYATKRVLPYLKLAVDRGRIGSSDAADVEAVMRRLVELAGPEEAPSRIHGDLWNGNVLWARESDPFLIDPAAHGGHRETDLAMLALFGLPQLHRLLDSYQEVRPLAEGWQERVPLHQLHPLLVHACLFGSSYGSRAGEAARSYR